MLAVGLLSVGVLSTFLFTREEFKLGLLMAKQMFKKNDVSEAAEVVFTFEDLKGKEVVEFLEITDISFIKDTPYKLSELLFSKHFQNLWDSKSCKKLKSAFLILEYFDRKLEKKFFVTFELSDVVQVPVQDEKRKNLTFKKTIIQAILISGTKAFDVTDTVLKFAGPKCNFFQKNVALEDILFKCGQEPAEPFEKLILLDTFGLKYCYNLNTEKFINWPKDSEKHKLEFH